MFSMEEILCEVHAEDTNGQGLPPGFRFHPTDEELITFYLASKVLNGSFGGVEIAEVDLNRCEPWELPDVAKMGEREWYFFSLRDRKYPTGLRTNRATGAGYWKATGKDKEIYSASTGALLGMKKTLVFYKGRAPRGEKTKWVMHEYRLEGHFSCRHTSMDEWVICRIFNKNGGEKKNPFLDAHRYLVEAAAAASCSSHSTALPQLLFDGTPQSRFMEYQPQSIQMRNLQNLCGFGGIGEDLIKQPTVSVNQTQVLTMNSLQSSFSPTITTTFNSNSSNNENKNISHSRSILVKSLLSHSHHQDVWARKEATVPKQCRTESSFSHFQQLLQDVKSNFHHHDHDHDDHQGLRGSLNSSSSCQQNQNPSFFETIMMGSVGGVSGYSGTVHEMSTSEAFNRSSSQMMLDAHTRVPPAPCGSFDP